VLRVDADGLGQARAQKEWYALASSADGRVVAALTNSGQVWVSTDYAINWTATGTTRDRTALAVSADGSRIFAASQNGPIEVTADDGASWLSTPAPVRLWKGIASSADGTRLVAVADGGSIYTSSDAGLSWTARETARHWSAVTSSADGQHLVATTIENIFLSTTVFIYTSFDQGVTWTAREPSDGWTSVASSADGSKVVAVSNNEEGSGTLWTSVPSSESTTVGTVGLIIGRQHEAIELQYIGGGVFLVLDAIGTGFDVH